MPPDKIPGEVGWTVTGDKTVEFARNPISFVESRIEKHDSKIFIARVLNKPTIFVTSNNGVRDILVTHQSSFRMGYKDFGYMHALFGDLFLFEDDENAYRVRNLVKELFHSTHCDNYMTVIMSIIGDTLENVHLRSSVDIYEVFKDMITNVCLTLFLDISQEEYHEYKNIAKTHWHGLISVPVSVKVKGWASAYSKADEAKGMLLSKIKEKLKSSNNRFLQLVSEAGFESDDEACSHLLLFISSILPKAMSSLLTSFVLETAGHFKEHMREGALEDENYLESLLLEVQRLFPPLYGGRRYTTEEVIIDGFTIPKDHCVAYITKYANRDSNIFEQADVFIPERWSNRNCEKQHLIWTFGGGSRSCIGIHFINRILKSTSLYLLSRFDWSLINDVVPEYKTLPVARPKEPVFVAFLPKSTKEINGCKK